MALSSVSSRRQFCERLEYDLRLKTIMRLIIATTVIAIGAVFTAAMGTPSIMAHDEVPAATNIRVSQGEKAGEVIVAWDAAHYLIGSVNMERDFEIAKANGDWQESFRYVDIVNRRQTTHTIRGLEPGAYHAFTVFTAESRYGKPTWPRNPTWVYLTPLGDICRDAVPNPDQEMSQEMSEDDPADVATISVSHGDEPGEIVIAWNAPPPEAAYFRIGSANMARDYPGAKAKGDWQEALTYVNVLNRGQTSHVLHGLKPGDYYVFTILLPH